MKDRDLIKTFNSEKEAQRYAKKYNAVLDIFRAKQTGKFVALVLKNS